MASTPVTIPFSAETKAELELVASAKNRSVSHLVVQAIEQLLRERGAKRKMITEAMAETDKEYSIPGDEVMVWFMSLSTD